MARIELPPGDADELMRLWSMNTDLARAAVGFSSAVYASDLIPVRTRELMRMRIAQINHCEVCLETRLEDPSTADIDEPDYEHVGEWATWPGYTPAERVAIELAEKVAVDHTALDDEWFAAAREHFTDKQLHGMVVMTGAWIALGRVQAVFDVHTSCPIRI